MKRTVSAGYSVQLSPAAVRRLKKLPREAQRQLVQLMEGLAAEPRPNGAVKMAGKILADIRVVRVLTLGHRREVYRRL